MQIRKRLKFWIALLFICLGLLLLKLECNCGVRNKPVKQVLFPDKKKNAKDSSSADGVVRPFLPSVKDSSKKTTLPDLTHPEVTAAVDSHGVKDTIYVKKDSTVFKDSVEVNNLVAVKPPTSDDAGKSLKGSVAYKPSSTANTDTWDEVFEGISSSFNLPLSDLFNKKYDSEWDNLTDGLSMSLSLNFPLKKADMPKSGFERDGEQFSNNTFSIAFKYSPLSYWYASIAFINYFNPELKAPWNPDFTYTFGYDDWHPYTLSLVYSNYGGNRLNPDEKRGEKVTRFEEGTITIGFKLPAADIIQYLVKVSPDGGLSHVFNYNITPAYSDAYYKKTRRWKHTISLATKYTIINNFYFTFTLFFYPDPSTQQPWNPDYTFGFGYFDWHPGTFSFQYNNYSGNRYPWKKQADNTGRFIDGSLSVNWSWVF